MFRRQCIHLGALHRAVPNPTTDASPIPNSITLLPTQRTYRPSKERLILTEVTFACPFTAAAPPSRLGSAAASPVHCLTTTVLESGSGRWFRTDGAGLLVELIFTVRLSALSPFVPGLLEAGPRCTWFTTANPLCLPPLWRDWPCVDSLDGASELVSSEST